MSFFMVSVFGLVGFCFGFCFSVWLYPAVRREIVAREDRNDVTTQLRTLYGGISSLDSASFLFDLVCDTVDAAQFLAQGRPVHVQRPGEQRRFAFVTGKERSQQLPFELAM